MGRIIVTVLCLLFAVFNAYPVEFKADSKDVKFKGNIVTYIDQVQISYGDVMLNADRVEYNTKTKEARAVGNALLIQGDEFIASDSITYNFETGKGLAEYGLSASEPWYAWGEKIYKVDEGKYEIVRGYLTTSDQLDPQWRLKARKATVYVNDKIVAKDVVLYFGKVPVLWLPAYIYSISDDGSPLNIVMGHNSRWGAFILVSYSWFLDYVKPTLHLDYREKNEFATGVDLDIYGPGQGRGKLQTYYIDDQHRELDDGSVITDERYRVSFRQDQPLTNNIYGYLELHKLSDIDLLEDFYRDEHDLEVHKESFLSVTQYDPNYTINVFARPKINDFYNVLEKLPEISFDVREQPIGGSSFYYSSASSLAYLEQNFADDSPDTDFDSSRVDSLQQFSYPDKYFGWLNIIPRVNLRGTYYSDGEVESDLLRGVITTELEFFTKLFRVWDTENPEADIDGIRHVLEPRVVYTYRPTPNKEPEELLQFDRIDSVDQRNAFKLDLRNKIQTKRHGGVWDLVDLDTFVFLFPDEEDNEGNTLSDFFFDLELRPSRHFYIDADAQYDPNDGRLDEFNTQLTYYDRDYWSVNLEHRFRDDENNLLAAGLFYQLSPEWAFRAYSRYEFEDSDLEETQISLIRDHNVWETSLTYRVREDENQVWLMLYLKDYPNVPISAGN